MFNVGDKAVYPGHGVGVIRRIEARMIGGVVQRFFVLQIIYSGATLMVPANGCDRAGMRPLANIYEVDAVWSVLSEPVRIQHTTWNRRFREFNDKLRSGSLLDTAEVLRDLHALKADKDLSYGEKKMLDKAVSMLAHEIALVTNTLIPEVEAEIADALNGVNE